MGSSRVGLLKGWASQGLGSPEFCPRLNLKKSEEIGKFFLEMGSISQWNWHPKIGSSQSCLQLPTHTLKMKFGSVQSLSRVRLFATPWTATRQASLSITNSWSLLKLISIESVMPSNCLILCRPFSSHLQSFPALGSFPMIQFFTSGGHQSIGASASVLPMNIQD